MAEVVAPAGDPPPEAEPVASAEVHPAARISPVWLVPLVALGFGAWLAWSAYQARGVRITIRFPSAAGIVPEKTEVRSRGVVVGEVRAVRLAPGLDGALVEVEMERATRPYLTDRTRFWRVSAEVSATGVSELRTLLAGAYIAVLLDRERRGRPARRFTALPRPPPRASSGLHLTLLARELGAVTRATRLLHHGLPVGRVTGFAYDAAADRVRIEVVVAPEHAARVRRNTRFWNAGGLTVRGGLRGLEVRAASLATLVAGGIAFDLPPGAAPGPPGGSP